MDKLWTSIVKFRATASREQGHWGAPRFSVRLRYDTEIPKHPRRALVPNSKRAQQQQAASSHTDTPLFVLPPPPRYSSPTASSSTPCAPLRTLAAWTRGTSGHCKLSRAQIARGAGRERRRRSWGRGWGEHRGARRGLFLRNPRRRGRSVLVSNLVRGLARHCQGLLPFRCLRLCDAV